MCGSEKGELMKTMDVRCVFTCLYIFSFSEGPPFFLYVQHHAWTYHIYIRCQSGHITEYQYILFIGQKKRLFSELVCQTERRGRVVMVGREVSMVSSLLLFCEVHVGHIWELRGVCWQLDSD